MKKITDFTVAAVGSGLAVIADLYWLVNDIIHAGRFDHAITSVALLLSLGVTVYSYILHKKTGSKPVQSVDDIDYRIELVLQQQRFKSFCEKEKALEYLNARRNVRKVSRETP